MGGGHDLGSRQGGRPAGGPGAVDAAARTVLSRCAVTWLLGVVTPVPPGGEWSESAESTPGRTPGAGGRATGAAWVRGTVDGEPGGRRRPRSHTGLCRVAGRGPRPGAFAVAIAIAGTIAAYRSGRRHLPDDRRSHRRVHGPGRAPVDVVMDHDSRRSRLLSRAGRRPGLRAGGRGVALALRLQRHHWSRRLAGGHRYRAHRPRLRPGTGLRVLGQCHLGLRRPHRGTRLVHQPDRRERRAHRGRRCPLPGPGGGRERVDRRPFVGQRRPERQRRRQRPDGGAERRLRGLGL